MVRPAPLAGNSSGESEQQAPGTGGGGGDTSSSPRQGLRLHHSPQPGCAFEPRPGSSSPHSQRPGCPEAGSRRLRGSLRAGKHLRVLCAPMASADERFPASDTPVQAGTLLPRRPHFIATPASAATRTEQAREAESGLLRQLVRRGHGLRQSHNGSLCLLLLFSPTDAPPHGGSRDLFTKRDPGRAKGGREDRCGGGEGAVRGSMYGLPMPPGNFTKIMTAQPAWLSG